MTRQSGTGPTDRSRIGVARRALARNRRGRREEWLQPTRIGDPEAPLSDRVLEEKYFELVTPVLGEAKAKDLLARLWKLE